MYVELAALQAPYPTNGYISFKVIGIPIIHPSIHCIIHSFILPRNVYVPDQTDPNETNKQKKRSRVKSDRQTELPIRF